MTILGVPLYLFWLTYKVKHSEALSLYHRIETIDLFYFLSCRNSRGESVNLIDLLCVSFCCTAIVIQFCVYIYIYIYICVCVCVCVYIYIFLSIMVYYRILNIVPYTI